MPVSLIAESAVRPTTSARGQSNAASPNVAIETGSAALMARLVEGRLQLHGMHLALGDGVAVGTIVNDDGAPRFARRKVKMLEVEHPDAEGLLFLTKEPWPDPSDPAQLDLVAKTRAAILRKNGARTCTTFQRFSCHN